MSVSSELRNQIIAQAQSICGQEGARILAEKAGIIRESRVPDVGSGLGEAACYLATS